MANETVYPLATQDGQYIPLDIVRPEFSFQLALSNVVSPNVNLPSVDKLIILYADIAAYISFGAVPAAVPANGVITNNLLFLPPQNILVCLPTDIVLSAISALGVNGTLFVTGATKWEALGKPVMFNRK